MPIWKIMATYCG